jgi:integrase
VQAPSTRDADKVNPDLVMTPAQVRALARACAAIEPRAELYVLLQGFCGLRPGEAGELRRRDLEKRQGRIVSVTARASFSAVPERFLDPGESRRRPLKGRGPRASRTIPVPWELSPIAEHHLRTYVAAGADAYVFTTAAGTRLNASNFQRDVWRPARRAVFGGEGALAGVRRHDLRHGAITAWLNAGVPLKTAQAWSGHRTASVLLDTYLGVMRGDEDLATQKFEALLGRDEVENS